MERKPENKVLKFAHSDSNARGRYASKELVASYTVVAWHKGDFALPVRVRCYMGRGNSASTVYANVWIGGGPGKHSSSGHGTAGGSGYDKLSAAVDEALWSAGVRLENRFHGEGEYPTKEALKAVAWKMGFRKFTIIQ